MTIKFSSAAANQYLSMADTAGLTYPAGDFCLGWLISIDTVSGSNPEYLISNGPYQSAGSLNIAYNASSNNNNMQFYANASVNDLGTAKSYLSGVWVFVLQRSGTTLTIRACPILSTLPTDGSSITTDTKTGYSTTEFDGSSGIFIGARSDLTTTRFANQSIGRVFRYDGTLTDLEVAKLGYGMEITDLGHTPAWYIRMDTATDIADRGSQQNAVTAHGTLVTGTAPAFGYTGTPVAPTITSAPAIVGGASVGSASSVTPGATTGNPSPTNSFQWNINGVAVSGQTGTTYTPVPGDVGKTLTVTQTSSNGVGTAATSTSAGVVVTTATSTIDVAQITAERIFQRASGVASITMSGTYTNTVPTSIEYQMYAADGSTVLVPWTAIAGAVISSGSWSGTPAVAQGGMYRLCVRSKNGSSVLATSNIKANLFGVGDIFAWIGSSSASRQFDSYSGTGYVPAANTRRHTSGVWSAFGTDGCAIQTANDLAARLGVPIGMMGYGVGGVTLADWLNQSTTPWTDFASAIASVGGKIAGLYNSVGSNDAANGLVSSRSSHLANLRQLISNVRTLTAQPSLKVLHSGFNRRPAVADIPANYVRMAENDFGDDANVYHVQTVDYAIRDDDLIHLTPAAFAVCAARVQLVFGQILTGGAYIRGPKVSSITYSSSAVKINVTHRNGSALTPTSNITGITATDDSGALTFSSVVATSGTQITATPSRSIVGVPKVTYLSGSSPVSTVAAAPVNEVFDNGTPALPMTVETEMVATAGNSLATTLTFTVVKDIAGTPADNATGLDYSIYEATRLNANILPIKYGTLSIVSGSVTLDITGATTLSPGGTVRINYGPSDGSKVASALVTVS